MTDSLRNEALLETQPLQDMLTTMKCEVSNGVAIVTLSRPDQHNTITPELRSDLNKLLDHIENDATVKVILLQSDGDAFCSGYKIDTFIDVQAEETESIDSWDSVVDLDFMWPNVATFLRLWHFPKPIIAAVDGWCIGGGSDLVMCVDVVIASEASVFGYPPVRRWGMPTTPMWLHRMGAQDAKRYLLTGDEISGHEAQRIGLAHAVVASEELRTEGLRVAQRMAQLPLNQLKMIKLYCNQIIDSSGVRPQATFSTMLDGVARHTPEGLEFASRVADVGLRQAVRERDDPFEDYGSRPKTS